MTTQLCSSSQLCWSVSSSFSHCFGFYGPQHDCFSSVQPLSSFQTQKRQHDVHVCFYLVNPLYTTCSAQLGTSWWKNKTKFKQEWILDLKVSGGLKHNSKLILMFPVSAGCMNRRMFANTHFRSLFCLQLVVAIISHNNIALTKINCWGLWTRQTP